jgi:hypothetical protein
MQTRARSSAISDFLSIYINNLAKKWGIFQFENTQGAYTAKTAKT